MKSPQHLPQQAREREREFRKRMPEGSATGNARSDHNGRPEREGIDYAWCKASAFVMEALLALLQVKCQQEGNICHARPQLICAFVIALSLSIAAFWFSDHVPRNIARLSGTLANAILMFMVEPFLGWVAFIIWLLFLMVVVRGAISYLKELILGAIMDACSKLLMMARHGRQEDQLPRVLV